MKYNNYIYLFLLLTIALVFNACFSKSMFDSPAIESEIKRVLFQQQADWNEGDIDGFMKGYWNNEQLSFIGSKGITRGWQQTLENYKKGYPDEATMGKLTFEVIELNILSDSAAFMIGKYTLVRTNDQPSGYFNLLWERKGDNWVIVSDHTSG